MGKLLLSAMLATLLFETCFAAEPQASGPSPAAEKKIEILVSPKVPGAESLMKKDTDKGKMGLMACGASCSAKDGSQTCCCSKKCVSGASVCYCDD